MSYIGATGLTEYEERFDTIEEEIDSNANYINTLVGFPDPIHLGLYGVNILNPIGVYGLVERAEVNIGLLQSGEEGLGSDISALTTQVEGIETSVGALETSVGALEGQVLGIEGDISTLNGAVFLEGGAIALVELQAADALTKANRALGIWDYSGDNVYHKKSGNVGIGVTFGSVLTNKLEVNGNINIPIGSTFRINNEPFNYSHLAGTQPVSSKWTNATDVATNIYYNSGNVGIGITTAINNKLEVAGNLNISAGSKYKINNVDLAFSDLAGTLSYNSLTNQLTGGTNIQILNGVINNTYELPKATTAVIGGVRPDGSTITINTSTGVISSAAATPQVNSDWTQTNTSLKSFIQNKPTAGTNISLANNTITNIITGSPTQNIIDLNNNYLIVKDKPDSQIVSQVDVPLSSVNEPNITSPAFTETIRTFTHSGGTESQTTHTITIGQNTICDILIVGGGGSGDRQIGGGGGGGAVLYATNITIPAGSYTIKVGKGGENGNGGNSEVFGAICLGGGSTPFVAWGTPNNGTAGGSGSGASSGGGTDATGGTVGASTKGTLLSSGTLYNGNIGGNALRQTIGQAGTVCGGGGGGAGTAGFNSSSTQYTTRSSWLAGGSPSKGGDGIQINITGTTYYWGAGGGGGSVVTHAGDGGLGGGGGGGFGSSGGTVYPAGLAGTGGINSGSNGLNTGTENGGNGGAGTGSGGGGGGYNANSATYNAGNGGSGIIIIKFRTIVNAGIPEGNPITHKTLNFAYVAPPLTYDFTNYNTYATWTAYATSIGATYSLNAGFTGPSDNGVYFGGYTIGFIQLPLPNTHNFMTVTFGNAWTDSVVTLLVNGTIKATSPVNGKTTYSQAYSSGDILRIEELLATIDGDLIIVLTNTNYITNTYTLSVQQGTSIQVNNGTAQYLSGNYTISVGATQSSVVVAGVSGIGPAGQTDPYPLTNGSTIAIRYSMLQRITSTINIKKDGLIKYVSASTTNPTTGSWNIIDIDTQPLTQFSGNLDWSRISSQPALSALSGNLDWSRIASQPALSTLSGNLDWSRIASQPALSALSGNLNWSRIDSKPALADLSGSLLWSRIDQSSFYIPSDRWIQDNHAYNRFFLAYNGTTYIQGYQTQPVEFRNGVSTPIAWFNDSGEFTCMFETQSSTNSDHVIIRGNTGYLSRNRYRLLLGHETFTGFHRCYTDDELYNEDGVDIFKNNYKGRIVISTGKIKTDSSRDIPNTDGDGETKSEWYSAIDKDGIMIEDAIPIVQLSRVKKDKRVYGVFGSPTRSTNNKNRLIVNSVGEGAICVCNTNGNIENGDYIQSSELLGFGEKQDDDILHNYSVAKAVMDCTFDLDSPYYQCYELESGNGSVRVAFIACTYHCG